MQTVRRQYFHGLVVAQIDPAGQHLRKVGFYQHVHYRPLHIGQVQGHSGVFQSFVQAFQTFHGAGIQVIDAGAVQHHMLNLRVRLGLVVDTVLQGAGIAEIEGFVHPDGQHLLGEFNAMAIHVAKMMGTGNAAQLGHMGLAGAPQEQGHGKHYPQQ